MPLSVIISRLSKTILERPFGNRDRIYSSFVIGSSCNDSQCQFIIATKASSLHFQSCQTNFSDKACEEATQYAGFRMDGVIIENMNDIPYVKAEHVGPEIVASMTTVANEVRRCVPSLPIGIQILAGANKEALAVAMAADLDFIRAGMSRQALHTGTMGRNDMISTRSIHKLMLLP